VKIHTKVKVNSQTCSKEHPLKGKHGEQVRSHWKEQVKLSGLWQLSGPEEEPETLTTVKLSVTSLIMFYGEISELKGVFWLVLRIIELFLNHVQEYFVASRIRSVPRHNPWKVKGVICWFSYQPNKCLASHFPVRNVYRSLTFQMQIRSWGGKG